MLRSLIKSQGRKVPNVHRIPFKLAWAAAALLESVPFLVCCFFPSQPTDYRVCPCNRLDYFVLHLHLETPLQSRCGSTRQVCSPAKTR